MWRWRKRITKIFFLLKQGTRLRFETGRDDDLAENLADRLGQLFGYGPIRNDDAAEGRLFVGGKSLLPGFPQIGIARHPAGVRVLQDRDGRLGEFGNQIGRSADVEDVVKGKLLSMELLE